VIEWADADWGTVPAWFSGIGTVGTLSVTTRVLVKNRQRERSEQARAVAVWEDDVDSLLMTGARDKESRATLKARRGKGPARIWIRNGSTLPISLPTYLADFKTSGTRHGALFAFVAEGTALEDGQVVTTLRPGDSAETRVPNWERALSRVMFVTADGQGWERDLLTGELDALSSRQLKRRKNNTDVWLRKRGGLRRRVYLLVHPRGGGPTRSSDDEPPQVDDD
jgi:hypothetical protein